MKKIKKVKNKVKRKTAKKTPSIKKAVSLGKPIGEVTHYYGKIKVAILKFQKPVKLGAKIKIKGATSNFEEVIKSMQFDHRPVALAKPKQLVGVRVVKRAREGDKIYLVK